MRELAARTMKIAGGMARLCVAFVLMLSACAGDSCPSDRGSRCTDEQQGLTCRFDEAEGSDAYCTCGNGLWSCNTCPGGDSPVGACEAGQACNVWGFENSCACTCTQDGVWSCLKDDPDPNFHCSP